MALPSVHVICGFAGGDGAEGQKQGVQPIFRDPQWSEEPASGTPTTNKAEEKSNARPVFRITNTVDVFVSIAASPNTAASPRFALRTSDAPHDIYVKPGDKLAWVAA